MDEPPLGFRPRQERGVAARTRVYDAAIRQFAEKGVAATRIEDVVAAAGVAWGTFYRYFPRKEDVLLEAAVRHFRERLVPLVEADLADSRHSTQDKALRLFVALLEPGEHPPQLRAEMLNETIKHRERFGAMLGGDDHALVQLVARVVAQGQERGEVRTDIDRFTLAGTLIAGIIFTTIYAYYGAFRGFRDAEPTADLPTLLERILEIIWHGFKPIAHPTEPPALSRAT